MRELDIGSNLRETDSLGRGLPLVRRLKSFNDSYFTLLRFPGRAPNPYSER